MPVAIVPGKGYTKEETLSIFGTDFTGIQSKGNLFYPDPTAIERAQKMGTATVAPSSVTPASVKSNIVPAPPQYAPTPVSPAGTTITSTPQGTQVQNTPLQKKVLETQGSLVANKEFINAVFKAFHGRDANAQELAKFTGQTVDQSRSAIMAGAPKKPNATAPSFNVDVPSTIPSDIVENATQVPKSLLDIKSLVDKQQQELGELSASRNKVFTQIDSLITQRAEMQKQFLDSLKLSDNYLKLQTHLADVRKRGDQIRQSFEEGIVDIEGQPIPMAFITGQARELEKRANLKLTANQREEANLLESVGLEEKIRQANLETVKAGLSFIKDDIDTQVNLADLLGKEEERVLKMTERLEDRSKEFLVTILESLAGLRFDELLPEDQQRLVELANLAGIPTSVLIQSLKTAADQKAYNKMKDELGLKEIQSRIGSNEALAARRSELTGRGGSKVGGKPGETSPEDFDPEDLALAEAYNKGESLGSIGAEQKGRVLIIAKELKRLEALDKLNDPDALADQINAELEDGESFEEIRERIEGLGISKEVYQEALRRRVASLEEGNKNTSFFNRLFGIGEAEGKTPVTTTPTEFQNRTSTADAIL